MILLLVIRLLVIIAGVCIERLRLNNRLLLPFLLLRKRKLYVQVLALALTITIILASIWQICSLNLTVK